MCLAQSIVKITQRTDRNFKIFVQSAHITKQGGVL